MLGVTALEFHEDLWYEKCTAVGSTVSTQRRQVTDRQRNTRTKLI